MAMIVAGNNAACSVIEASAGDARALVRYAHAARETYERDLGERRRYYDRDCDYVGEPC